MALPLFAYGSLMWQDVPFVRARKPALSSGCRVALCLGSEETRGSAACPGLFAGLIRARGEKAVGHLLYGGAAMHAWAHKREGRLYAPRILRTSEGWAYAYFPRKTHRLFCPDLPPAEVRRRVRLARGSAGTTSEYVRRLVLEQAKMGAADPRLIFSLSRTEERGTARR